MAFQYTGLMTVLDADAFLFDCRDIRAYFDAHGVAATDTEIAAIQKRSSGYPARRGDRGAVHGTR